MLQSWFCLLPSVFAAVPAPIAAALCFWYWMQQAQQCCPESAGAAEGRMLNSLTGTGRLPRLNWDERERDGERRGVRVVHACVHGGLLQAVI